MASFDVGASALLSTNAKKILRDEPDRFTEEQAVAIDLLGLTDLIGSLDDAQIARAMRAVVIQLNHQIAYGPAADNVVSERRGERSKTYTANGPSYINSTALQIARTLFKDQEDVWESSRSVRGSKYGA